MVGEMVLRYCKASSTAVSCKKQKVSSTYLFQNLTGDGDVLMTTFSTNSMKMLATTGETGGQINTHSRPGHHALRDMSENDISHVPSTVLRANRRGSNGLPSLTCSCQHLFFCVYNTLCNIQVCNGYINSLI